MTAKVILNSKDWKPSQFKALKDIQYWLDFLLDKPLEILSGEDTFDPGTIAAGASYTRSVNIDGVKAGQPTHIGLPDTSAGAVNVGAGNLTFNAYTRLGSLKLVITNRAAVGFTPGNITYRYMIFNVFPNVSVGA